MRWAPARRLPCSLALNAPRMTVIVVPIFAPMASAKAFSHRLFGPPKGSDDEHKRGVTRLHHHHRKNAYTREEKEARIAINGKLCQVNGLFGYASMNITTQQYYFFVISRSYQQDAVPSSHSITWYHPISRKTMLLWQIVVFPKSYTVSWATLGSTAKSKWAFVDCFHNDSKL